MTYEEYADAMNAHADSCSQCDASRKTGLTHGVCETAQSIIGEWKASKKTDEDMALATLNMIARELELLETEDEPQD